MDFEPKNPNSMLTDGRVDRDGNFVVGGYVPSNRMKIQTHFGCTIWKTKYTMKTP